MMFLANDHHLERINRPVRNEHYEMIVFDDNSLTAFAFNVRVIAQQTTSLFLLVFSLRPYLFRRFVGNAFACPDLAMRMRVARTHHLTPIFEDLNMIDK